MKTVFSLNGYVADALQNWNSKIDLEQVSNAIQSTIGRFELIESKGGIKGASEKKEDVRSREAFAYSYKGEKTTPAQFFVWHTKVGLAAEKVEKLGCTLLVAEIPPKFHDWLRNFCPDKQPVVA